MASPTTPLYPLTPTSLLTSHFIGKKLSTLPTPAIVLDRALIRRNCAAMLGICSALGVEFRAHVKSHKTIELSRMQVGDWEGEGQGKGEKKANFIVSTVLEAEQLVGYVRDVQGKRWDGSILYGVPVAQSSIPRLISLATELAPGSIHVLIDNLDAFTKLCERLRSAPEAVQLGIFIKIDTGYERAGIKTSSPAFPGLVQSIVAKTQEPGSKCFLKGFYSHFGHSVRMLVEVTSVYSERGKPEALVSAGSLAMGREPCKSYPGWGIVTGDLSNSSAKHIYDEREGKTGWIVGRISQEHGILTWEGERSECNELSVGDRVMVWPNHACVAGAGFGWYLVVDSDTDGETVVDAWVRWRGW
ncbi:conserved hypothetical protein [Pyrenophora tritici-repentis Pt-1C-BFP]|uniref:D-serine dehydratase-like domain-containing protein n=1 Tax=Pyrenophora tritici-repentis (strain Pt-1C-BFP) TaxID=426418 RepID=B2W8V7_PYRTR|nr:uncharacterized protein PTRG_06415 [Pyrenophora tritici-repentis Pt-1C-BFP]EDU49335.1 conserved hypothetical protein [Pyrenophora tritici-repentis Pt-1C-BFP]